ncbi:hypothetical protein [Streptomyces sp. NPDC046261]|uniref:wHTH domain-containing protein n=1 Tax=Streptomyces sp. NPDC046261 TaxID=3157200 RepID=UPI0034036522
MRGKDGKGSGVHGNDFGGDAVVQNGTGNELHTGDRYVQVLNVFPAADPPAPHAAPAARDPWEGLADGSEAWSHVDEGHDPEPLRQAARAIARRLASARDEAFAVLADDPWRDDGLAERIALRTDWLFDNIWSDEQVTVSPAEAALLSLLPLFHHTRALRRAAAHRKLDAAADRKRYELFLRRHDRLARRMAKLDPDDPGSGHREISSWLFHRWVAHDPDVAQEPWAADLLAVSGTADTALGGILDGPRLHRLLTAPDASPHELCGIDGLPHLPGERRVTPGRSREQRLREQLAGVAFTLARGLAIELTELPPTIVNHLGVSRAVDLAELRDAVDKARWDHRANGRERRLWARCRHNAVAAALREHATRVDALLRAVHRAGEHAAWPPELRLLPVYAGGDAVVQLDVHGGELPPREAVRFRFDENAVQELLVGERLYRNPSLAIRELYQNALDACRYSRARMRAHAQRLRLPADAFGYQGDITFRQGVDACGRAYLSCTDNGVGMGEEQLTGVFTEAGARFVDQPKYLAEQAEWSQLPEPVTLHPNSRFGIGVLSYFMLADEIEVTTCRLDRECRVGRRLRVRISGPGQFFHIEEIEECDDEGPGTGPGTTVKLYLREDSRDRSAAETLRALLGVAEFRTRVVCEGEGGTEETWEPLELSPRRRPSWESEGLDAYGTLVPWKGEGGQVVWCEDGGGLLVDGLLVQPSRAGVLGGTLRGAVVNLTGKQEAELSVDRTQVLNDVGPQVRRLLEAAAEELVRSDSGLLTFSWVCSVADRNPLVADIITRAALDAGVKLPLDRHGGASEAVGCFPADISLMERAEFPSGIAALYGEPPDHLLLWRILAQRWSREVAALSAAVPEITTDRAVLPALPTDVLVASDGGDVVRSWLPADVRAAVPGQVLRAASKAGTTPRAFARRSVELGFRHLVPERYPDVADPDPLDLTVLSQGLDGQSPWLSTDEPVPVMHLLYARLRRGIDREEARRRLTRYGFTVPDAAGFPTRPTHAETVLLSARQSDGPPWLDGDRPVPPAHLAACARLLDLTVTEVCERLADFGFTADRAGLPDRPTQEEAELLKNLIGSVTEPIAPGSLLAFAKRKRRSPAEVAAQLSGLGLTVPPMPPGDPDHDVLSLLSHDLLGGYPWASPAFDVPRGHVMAAAKTLGWSPSAVAECLSSFGFTVPAASVDHEPGDLELISHNQSGRGHWLRWQDQVPLSRLLEAALHLNRPLRDVADRLRYLGYNVPDVADTIRAALARVPFADVTAPA